MSPTTTLNVAHDPLLPALSVALHDTCEVPSPNVLPDAGMHDADEMPELSTAAKFQLTIDVGALPLVGVTDRGDAIEKGGHVKVGEVLSKFVIEKVHVEVKLLLSVVAQATKYTPSDEILTGLLALQNWLTIVFP